MSAADKTAPQQNKRKKVVGQSKCNYNHFQPTTQPRPNRPCPVRHSSIRTTTTQPPFVSNPRTISTQPPHILDSPTPTATQPLAKGFVRRRPKAPPHGASANTPYPFARTFAPPPHCRRINRGRFAASTTRCRRHQTLSCPMPPLTLDNGKQDRRTPRGTQQPLHRSRLRGCRDRPPLCHAAPASPKSSRQGDVGFSSTETLTTIDI